MNHLKKKKKKKKKTWVLSGYLRNRTACDHCGTVVSDVGVRHQIVTLWFENYIPP
jgi:pyridoxal/pyridoxine/pyridoxamine kinase